MPVMELSSSPTESRGNRSPLGRTASRENVEAGSSKGKHSLPTFFSSSSEPDARQSWGFPAPPASKNEAAPAPVIDQLRQERQQQRTMPSNPLRDIIQEPTPLLRPAKPGQSRYKIIENNSFTVPLRHQKAERAAKRSSPDLMDMLSSQAEGPTSGRTPPKVKRTTSSSSKAPRASGKTKIKGDARADGLRTTKEPAKRSAAAAQPVKRVKPKAVGAAAKAPKASTSKAIDLDDDESEAGEADPSFDIFQGLPDSIRYAADEVLGEQYAFEVPEFDLSKPLCPFCDELLPDEPSALLKQLLRDGKKRAGNRRRTESFNPDALLLPLSEHTSICSRHRAETTTIPQGLAAGYPQQLDFEGLANRIRRETGPPLMKVIGDASSSQFYVKAKLEWDTKGRQKMKGIINHLDSFDNEVPGYYGFKGLEIFIRTLKVAYLDSGILAGWKTAPLEPDAFIRRVLIPEATVVLMMKDHDLERPAAVELLEASRSYGMAVFGAEGA